MKQRRIACLLCWLGAVVWVPLDARSPVYAQGTDTLIVGPEVACEECRVSFGDGIQLRGPEAPGVLNYPKQIVRVGDSYLVVYHGFTEELHHYDARGRHTGRIGTTGGGPGEFRRIDHMVPAADGQLLYVFDGRNTRLALWDFDGSPEVLETHRTISNRLHSAIRLPDGRFLVNYIDRSPAGAPFRIHQLDPTGAHQGPFGLPSHFRADFFQHAIRSLALAPDNTVWSAHFKQYVLERFNIDGALTTVLVRDAGWFPAALRTHAIDIELGPPPMLRTIAVDGSGLVWTAVWVPDPRWRSEGVRGPVERESQQLFLPERASRVWDTIIEVIDPRAGVVLTRHRIDGLVESLGGGASPWVSIAAQDADGVVRLRVAPVTLHRP